MVILAHPKYISTLSLWYYICQSHHPLIHRITHYIIFLFSVKSPLATLMASYLHLGPRRAPETLPAPAWLLTFHLHSWYFQLKIYMPNNSKGLLLNSRLLSVFMIYNELKIWVEFVRRAGDNGPVDRRREVGKEKENT